MPPLDPTPIRRNGSIEPTIAAATAESWQILMALSYHRLIGGDVAASRPHLFQNSDARGVAVSPEFLPTRRRCRARSGRRAGVGRDEHLVLAAEGPGQGG